MARPVLLVTGGSRGIGAATCRLAATQGYDVAVNYQSRRDAADRVVEDCRTAGARAVAIAGDMAEHADIVRLFDETERQLGPVTHLLNNAGITGRASRLDEASPDEIRRVIDLNVTGAILVAREGALRMARSRGGAGGVMVNLSSAAVWRGAAGDFVWYAASKGAIDVLTLGLANELGPDGIRVNAVAPGLIETEIHEAAGRGGRIEVLAPGIPLQRGGSAEEVAQVIMFLMSEQSSYVTGAVYRVTGGR
jgi:NAD(P)-dependent dehydrogenase (short-subunit alcohol dehydrogenase family)